MTADNAPRDATRVLADVETALRNLIRQEASMVSTRRIVIGQLLDVRAFKQAEVARQREREHRAALKALLEVRRAARGGRDGGTDE